MSKVILTLFATVLHENICKTYKRITQKLFFELSILDWTVRQTLPYIETLITEKFEVEVTIIIRAGNVKENGFSYRRSDSSFSYNNCQNCFNLKLLCN